MKIRRFKDEDAIEVIDEVAIIAINLIPGIKMRYKKCRDNIDGL